MKIFFLILTFLSTTSITTITNDIVSLPKVTFIRILTSIFLPFLIYGIYKKSLNLEKKDFPVIFFLIVITFKTIFSIYPEGSFYGYYKFYFQSFLNFFCLSVIYFSVKNLISEKEIFKLLNYLKIILLFSIVYGIIQYLKLDRFPWEGKPYPRVWSFFGNPDFFASYIGIFFPLIFGDLFREKEKFKKIVSFVFFILVFFVLLLTKSRAVWVGSFSGILFFIFLQKNKVEIIKKSLILIIFSIALTFILTPQQAKSIIKRGISIFNLREENIKLRFLGYKAAIDMSKRNFLFGSGVDSYLWRFRRFVPEEFVKNKRFMAHAGYAHNQFLQFLVDSGLIGLGSYIFLFFSFIHLGIKKLSFLKDDKYIIYSSLISGIFSTFISGFFNFFPVVTWFYLFLFFSFIVLEEKKLEYKKEFLFFSIPLIILSVLPFKADIYFKKGIIYKNEKFLEKAKKLNPFVDFYKITLGKTLVEKGEFDKAIKTFEKLIKKNKNNALAYNGLGYAFRAKGNYKEAIKFFEKALEIDPYLIPSWLNMALSYEKLKEFEKAITCYKKVLELDSKNKISLFNIGVIYGNLKKYNEAKFYWERLFRIDPEYPKLKKYLQIISNLIKSKNEKDLRS